MATAIDVVIRVSKELAAFPKDLGKQMAIIAFVVAEEHTKEAFKEAYPDTDCTDYRADDKLESCKGLNTWVVSCLQRAV